MPRLSEADLAALARRFVRWRHPAVRDGGLSFVPGDGTEASARALFGLLEAFVAASTPAHALEGDGRDPWERLSERFIGTLQDLQKTPQRELGRIEELTRSLVLALEPSLMKLLAVLEPAEYLQVKKKGLETAVRILQKSARIPYELKLTNEEFIDPRGWESRDSYANALRDVFPERLDHAHKATAAGPLVWMSAVVVLLGAIDRNRADLERHLGPPPGGLQERAVGATIASGVPAARRLPKDAPEPVTTRQPLAEKFGARIREALSAGEPRVEILPGTPGWGKSTFVVLGLDGAPFPVRFSDLSGCSSGHDVAEGLLEGVAISDEERRAIDRRPISAVRILSDRLPTRSAIVLENMHRTPGGPPLQVIEEYVRHLHGRGHAVIIESWTSTLQLGSISQGQIRRPGVDLPPLADEEIAQWGRQLLDRELTAEEREVLRIFDGHPLHVRRALELIADRYPHGDEALDPNDFLELSEDFAWVRRQFEEVTAATLRAPAAFGHELLPAAMWAWFGVMPWARPTAAELPPEIATRARRVQSVGLTRIVGGRWHVEPYARVLGLGHCRGETLHLEDALEVLLALAPTVPEEHLEAQRRHCLRVAGFAPHARSTIIRILQALPAQAPREVTLFEADEPYGAPAKPEVIEAALGPASAPAADEQARPPEPSAPEPLPVHEQLWLLESAVRAEDDDRSRLVLGGLLRRPEALGGVLSSDWRALRQVHRTLLRPTASRDERVRLYGRLVPLVQAAEGPGRAEQGQRVWMARFLVAAAQSAAAVGERTLMSSFRERAEAVLATVSNLEAEEAQRLAVDTRYRLGLVDTLSGGNLLELIEAHVRILELIPPRAAWGPFDRDLWARRVLEHVGKLAEDERVTPELLKRLTECLGDVEDDLWLLGIARRLFGIERRGATELQLVLRREVERRARSYDRTRPPGVHMTALCLIFLDPQAALPHVGRWASEVAATARDGIEPAARWLFQACLDVDRPSAHLRHELATACAQMLDVLVDAPWVAGDENQLEALRTACLDRFARDQLMSWLDVEESDGAALARVGKGERRVRASFARHVKASGNAWLWDTWAKHEIRAVQRRNAIERQSGKGSARNLGDVEKRLWKFVDEARGALGEHPAANAVGLRVARYLWDAPEIRRHSQALLGAPLPDGMRRDALRLIVDAYSNFVLVPPILRMEDFREEPDDLPFLSRALRELYAGQISLRRHSLIGWMGEVLDHAGDPTYWVSLHEKARATLGSPDEYWPRIVAAAYAPAEIGMRDWTRLEELTDQEALNLVARFFRFGAWNEALPHALRFELAQLAVVASYDADQWFRSLRGRRAFAASWQVGSAIGLALCMSPDGKLFGSEHSHHRNRRGVPFTWREEMQREFDAASSLAAGRFRRLCSDGRQRFMVRLRELADAREREAQEVE